MSYTVVNDVSLLFDDSNIAIIPLDKNFEPDFKESEIYTSIFKISYKECKRDFDYSKTPRRCYAYPIGKNKTVIYLVDVNFKDETIKELVSVISRYLSNNSGVSILVKNRFNPYIKSFCDTVPFNLKVYDKVLAV